MNKNLIPFDLSRALKGDKVVTRDGKIVTEIRQRNDNVFPVLGRIEGSDLIQSFKRDGKYYSSGVMDDCTHDLFMAEPLQVQEEPEKKFPFWIKVKRCTKKDYWYLNRIGEVFEIDAIDEHDGEYHTRSRGKELSGGWFVPSDCEIIPEPMDGIEDKEVKENEFFAELQGLWDSNNAEIEKAKEAVFHYENVIKETHERQAALYDIIELYKKHHIKETK